MLDYFAKAWGGMTLSNYFCAVGLYNIVFGAMTHSLEAAIAGGINFVMALGCVFFRERSEHNTTSKSKLLIKKKWSCK